MNYIRLYTSIFFLISVIGYAQTPAKFEPTDETCLVFIGQDLEATGGLDTYTNGYTDFFDTPAGITVYTNISPSDESFGYYNRGLDGLQTKANWGAGDCCAQCYLDDSTYKNTIISIGLSIVNHEKKVGNGTHDSYIIALGNWIRESKRPVFLRIGYEFDGHDWNHYNRKHYLKAWERIYNIFRKMRIDNVAFVWQSKGTGSDQEALEDWYPGDDLVDWCAYSYFGNPDTEMLTFARKHNKPVFIAEASPTLQTDNLFFDTDLKKDIIAKRAWQQWFVPFFKTINDHKDVIKAISYINTNWSEQAMWRVNPVFRKVDSRIQVSPFISEKWKEEMAKFRYLKASDSLLRKLKSIH